MDLFLLELISLKGEINRMSRLLPPTQRSLSFQSLLAFYLSYNYLLTSFCKHLALSNGTLWMFSPLGLPGPWKLEVAGDDQWSTASPL